MTSTESTVALLTLPEDEPEAPAPGGWRVVVRGLLAHPLGVAGLAVIVLLAAACFLGPLVYHTDQQYVNLVDALQPPGPGHPLGTDTNGFDVLGRMMKGGQVSLEIGLLAAVIATVIGTLYGAVAGLFGGVVDAIMMRFVDVLLSIPFLFVVLVLSARFSSSVLSLSLVLGLFSWLIPARLVRGEVLTIRVRDFVAAARGMGARPSRIVLRHLIPNALSVVIVNVTFQIADAILAVATLGFLGFGLNYPNTDWGDQLSNGVTYISDGYWWLIYPVGGCLVVIVLAFNVLGEALAEALGRRAA